MAMVSGNSDAPAKKKVRWWIFSVGRLGLRSVLAGTVDLYSESIPCGGSYEAYIILYPYIRTEEVDADRRLESQNIFIN